MPDPSPPPAPSPRPARAFFRSEEGASMAEYALLVGIIGALCAVVLRTLGTSIRDLLLSFSP